MASPQAEPEPPLISLVVPSHHNLHQQHEFQPPSADTTQHPTLRSATKARSLSSLSSILLSEGMDAATKVIRSRSGQVLGKNTILKADNYSLHQTKDDRDIVPISGAPNFRRVCVRDGPTLYGVAQPTTFGIAGVVNFIISTEITKSFETASSSSPSLNFSSAPSFIWVNLREEPMIYLNQRPFVLRERERPFQNPTTYAGMDRERIERMETRLREDVLREAKMFGGNILVHDEGVREHNLKAYWEAIGSSFVSIQAAMRLTPSTSPANPAHSQRNSSSADGGRRVTTPKGIFDRLRERDGLLIEYLRLPTTPEQTPDLRHFDSLFNFLRNAPNETHIVFNCQLGGGRSTTFMILAHLISTWKQHRTPSLSHAILSTHVPASPAITHSPPPTTHHVVLQLISTLENGTKIKSRADEAIDSCAAIQNIRTRIAEYQLKAESSRDPPDRELLLQRTVETLTRYYYVIAFVAYLEELKEKGEGVEGTHSSFVSWLQSRPEIDAIIASGKANPEEALEFELPATTPEDIAQTKGKLKESSKDIITGTLAGIVTPPTASTLGMGLVAAVDALAVVRGRNGHVLTQNTILKYDHYPTVDATPRQAPQQHLLHHHSLVQLTGAPNFRKLTNVPRINIYGVGMPTSDGICNVLAAVTSGGTSLRISQGELSGSGIHKVVVWVNLREEPVVYINKKPCVLRRANRIFKNLDVFTGITATRVEQMEDRLKQDLIAEAQSFRGSVLIHDETNSGSVVPTWVTVCDNLSASTLTLPKMPDLASISKVRTPFEVYSNLPNHSTCELIYKRVPLTPEKPPEFSDFDDLVQIVREMPARGHLIFNCQLGRGRSTIAMVVASLVSSWLFEPGGPKPVNFGGESSSSTSTTPNTASPAGGSNSSLPSKGSSTNLSNLPPKNDLLNTPEGEFAAVLRLLRVLDEGPYRKLQVDSVIDACSHTINLRRCILDNRKRAMEARNHDEARVHEAKGADRLRTYFLLIVFNSYLSEMSSKVSGAENNTSGERLFLDFTQSFNSWINSRIEILTIYKELEDGLEFVETGGFLPLPEESAESVIKRRSGNVLGPSTILKCDHFPGCQRKGLTPIIGGAPNFRKVEGLNVYGVAIPTTDGIKNVLDHLHASSSEENPNSIIWTNLREEPVLYVNGRPFVLRSLSAPFANLEYTGIDPERVEEMEVRLKKDVLAEIAKYNGRILLHDEGEGGALMDTWESTSEPLVHTPREVYRLLQESGYSVIYNRLPITDEQAPEERDFDDLVNCLKDAPPVTHLIFNCQMGRGRTTTGMVIACMMRTSASIAETLSKSKLIGVASEDEDDNYPDLRMSASADEVAFAKGEYTLMLRLVRVLENGVVSKQQVDECIDKCSTIQNLREAIESLKVVAEREGTDPKARAAAKQRGIYYLIRYFFLVVFSGYLLDRFSTTTSTASPDERFAESFTTWVKARPELYRLLQYVDLS